MTEEEKERTAYERHRRYKRAKWKSNSQDTTLARIVVIIIMIVLAKKFGLH